MDTVAVLDSIIGDPGFAPYIVEERLLPAQEGRFVPFPPDLDKRIAAVLRNRFSMLCCKMTGPEVSTSFPPRRSPRINRPN